jgi:hypothetical protein
MKFSWDRHYLQKYARFFKILLYFCSLCYFSRNYPKAKIKKKKFEKIFFLQNFITEKIKTEKILMEKAFNEKSFSLQNAVTPNDINMINLPEFQNRKTAENYHRRASQCCISFKIIFLKFKFDTYFFIQKIIRVG